MAFEPAPLPSAPDALEPKVDARTMEIHHGQHHAALAANLKDALEKHPELAGKLIAALLGDLESVPEDIRGAVRNNGGCFYTHNLFWPSMSPDGGGSPDGALTAAIDVAFGSLDSFQETFAKAAMTRFGSGWAWLSKNGAGAVVVTSTPNQDTPLREGLTPLLGLDV